jgi:hypothetical protein
MTTSDRLNEMTDQIAALQAQVAALESLQPLQPLRVSARSPAVEPYPVVSQPITLGPLPSRQETRDLITIVAARHPQLKLPQDDWGFETEVRNALAALGEMNRQDTFNTKRYCAHWLDEAADILRRRGLGPDCSFRAFLVGCMVSNVIHNYPPADGEVQMFGLAESYTGKRPDTQAWKTCLSTRQLPARRTPERPRLLGYDSPPGWQNPISFGY